MVTAMRPAELVKRNLEAFNRRDAEAMLALYDAEIELVPITAAMEGRVLRGPDDVREFLRGIELDWEVFEARPQQFYEGPDWGLALGTWQARGRGSGLELNSQPGAWLARIRGGLIYRWRTHTERAAALEDLGLGEGQLAGFQVDPP
jgi:ketosteroid isomerase-like protein